MYCNNCGHEIKENAIRCINCGKYVSESDSKNEPAAVQGTDHVFENDAQRESYRLWKERGRMSLGKTDLFGIIGIFIGIVLWYAYYRAGKSAWHIFVPIIFLSFLGRVFIVFGIVAIIALVWAWMNLRTIVRSYEEIYQKEST